MKQGLTFTPAGIGLRWQLLPLGDGAYQMTPRKPSPHITVRETCAVLGLSRSSVYRLCSEGQLTYARPGKRKMLIDAASLQTFVNNRTEV